MSETIQQSSIQIILDRVNEHFDVHLNSEDFKSMTYSSDSFADIVVQKIQDEKSGDWTADIAFHKLRKAIHQVCGIAMNEVNQDTELNIIFPPKDRKQKMTEMEKAMGVPMNILRPNNGLYGTFIFLFFAGIPLFSLGWFPAVLTMLISGIVIYILSKTANTFKMKTVGLLADYLAWKNYLKDKQDKEEFDREATRQKVLSLMK